MKLNVISDLHCGTKNGKVQWFDFEPEKLKPADYLIVAGDTGYMDTEHQILAELKERTKGKFKQILAIRGNHSNWVMEPYNEKKQVEKYGRVLSPEGTIDVVDGNVAIIGTTLWTNAVSEDEVRMMNDYNYIPGFTPLVKLLNYEREAKWLRIKYNEYKEQGKRIVIVTHHNPRPAATLPEQCGEHLDVESAYWVQDAKRSTSKWREKIVTPSFRKFNKGLIRDVNDLKPEIWICGHIHENLDAEIDGTRFIRHPIGYRWGWFKYDPKKHPGQKKIMNSWYNKIVKIDENDPLDNDTAFYRRMSENHGSRQKERERD